MMCTKIKIFNLFIYTFDFLLYSHDACTKNTLRHIFDHLILLLLKQNIEMNPFETIQNNSISRVTTNEILSPSVNQTDFYKSFDEFQKYQNYYNAQPGQQQQQSGRSDSFLGSPLEEHQGNDAGVTRSTRKPRRKTYQNHQVFKYLKLILCN